MARSNTQEERTYEDVSSFSPGREQKKETGPRHRFSPKRLAAMAACLLLVVAGSGLMMLASHLDGMTASAASLTKDPDKLGIAEKSLSVDGVTNIAVFGVDSRTGEHTGASDLIMVVTVDEVHNKVKMTSLLRDAKVLIQGTGMDGGEVDTETALYKAYELGGPELAIRTINRNYGLDIRDYAALNFNGMAAVIDALGGVEVRLTAEEVREINVNLQLLERDVAALQASGDDSAADLPQVQVSDYIPDASGRVNVNSGNYAGGVFHLNGNQAVAYGRIRSIDSDAVRSDRQQVVLAQVLHILQTDRTRDLSAWAKALLPHCVTSLGVSDFVALAGILAQSPALETIKAPDGDHEEMAEETAADGTRVLSFDRQAVAGRIQAFVYEEKAPSWSTYGNTGRDADRDGSMD